MNVLAQSSPYVPEKRLTRSRCSVFYLSTVYFKLLTYVLVLKTRITMETGWSERCTLQLCISGGLTHSTSNSGRLILWLTEVTLLNLSQNISVMCSLSVMWQFLCYQLWEHITYSARSFVLMNFNLGNDGKSRGWLYARCCQP